MTSRQLVRAARVANATLDGWLADAAVEVVDGRIASVGRAGDLPTDIAATHEVHDLGDVSLLPGFVETHIHMHFPAPPGLPRDRPAGAGRALAHPGDRGHAAPAAVGRDDRPRHRQPRRRGPRDPVRDPGRRHPRAAPARRRGADHHDRRALLVPRWRGRHDRRGRSRASASARRPGWTRSRSWRPAAATRRRPTRARSSTTLETMPRPTAEAHRLGLPVLAHSLTAASNRICAEAGVDTIIHGGVWWTDYPVRDRAYAYDPAVADRIAARGIWVDPTIGEVELHEEHHAAGRTGRCRSSSTGRCPTCRASSSRASGSCATWPTVASGSSAGWAWACRSSRSTRSPAAPRSTPGCWASTRGGRSRRSRRTRPRRWGSAGDGRRHPAGARRGPRRGRGRPDRATSRAGRCAGSGDVIQGGRPVVRDGHALV